jgi:hypothetical protein
VEILISGVPDSEYQCLNCVKSKSFASLIATVFRDQEFTADLHARSSKRIEDVNALRTLQFAEDAGPMAHPVRPEHYIENARLSASIAN